MCDLQTHTQLIHYRDRYRQIDFEIFASLLWSIAELYRQNSRIEYTQKRLLSFYIKYILLHK